MNAHDEQPNGKATIGLVVQVAGVVIAIIVTVATPLILMYSKLNALEVTLMGRMDEVETQFRALDEFRNINLASQMRYNALLWKQTYGSDFPNAVYFPQISRQK